MAYFCQTDRFVTPSGDALPGYEVRAYNLDTSGNLTTIADIFTDRNGTPAANNTVVQNDKGNYTFFIAPGTYAIECLDPVTDKRVALIEQANLGYEADVVLAAAEQARDDAQAAATAAASDAGDADADRIAAEAAAALADTYRALVEAMLATGGNPYANTYASALPRGVTSVTIGGTAITGATVGEYPITGSGGSITGYSLTLVVTSATTATVRVDNTGLGSGTTPPTLTKPAGATLPAGTTLTAVVAPIVADQRAYAYASSDSSTVLFNRNNGGSVAALNNPDGTQISFLNAREFRRFIARSSTWRNTAFAVANPHLLRAKVNLIMADGSTPADCYVYDIRRDLSTRLVIDIKRVSDNLRIGALAATTSGATVASYINPVTESGANGGIGQVTLPIILTTEAAAAGFSSASNVNIDFGGGETWGGVQDGTTKNHVLNAGNMGLDAASRTLVQTIATNTVKAATTSISPFLSTVTDAYLRSIVDDIIIDNGVEGRTYVLNWRSDTVSSTRRLQFYLYDPVRGANVAIFSEQQNTDWSASVPESVYLSGASNGAPRGDVEYVGLGCTIWLKPGTIDFSKGASSYTTTAAGGINPNRVWSPEETERRIVEGRGHRNKIKTFGPGGDYATLKAAVDALIKPTLGAPDDVQRAWWPYSNLCTPAHQWTLQAMPGHSEVKTPAIPPGVPYARGILTWMGMTIRLLADTQIKGETTGAVETYALDSNMGGRIIAPPTALIWSDGSVAVHHDSKNDISIKSAANAADKMAGQQHFRIVTVVEGGWYKSNLQAWSCGASDGERFYFRPSVLETVDTGTANFTIHTSPSNVLPAYYEFDGITCKGGNKSFAFIKSVGHTVAARHGVKVTNCDVTSISATASSTAFVRIGKQNGVTYAAEMEP